MQKLVRFPRGAEVKQAVWKGDFIWRSRFLETTSFLSQIRQTALASFPKNAADFFKDGADKSGLFHLGTQGLSEFDEANRGGILGIVQYRLGT